MKMKFYDPELKRIITEFEVQQEFLYIKSLGWWVGSYAQFVQTYLLNVDFTVITNTQLEYIEFKEDLKMNKLPVTFVLENAIYSVGSKHKYYKRESGKPIKIISENQFVQARDQFLALQKSAKPKSIPNPKPKHPKSVKYNSSDLSLTEKQVDFLKVLNATLTQHEYKNKISVSDFMEKADGHFHNNPMAVGAMLTTLRQKNVLSTWLEESTGVRMISLEGLGLDVLKQIGGSKPCK